MKHYVVQKHIHRANNMMSINRALQKLIQMLSIYKITKIMAYNELSCQFRGL